MKCLICGQDLETELSFTSLLLLKKEETYTCSACFNHFERISPEHCPTCFKEGETSPCQDCQYWYKEGIQVEHEAVFTYNEAMKDYFHRYKFDGDYLLRKVFTKVLYQKFQKYKDYQLVLIPLSKERLQQRGFNQVEGLIEGTGLFYYNIIDKKEVKIGATSGPYADMVNKAIKPLLEKKGYSVKVTEFSDYIQPNKALNSGELDANLFQHKIYMKKFAEQNNMDLTALVPVPTAPMGLYSDKVKDLKDLPDGAEVTLPNDPSNAARAYALLAAADLIKIKPDTDVLKITKNDVIENPKNLKFTELEAGQLARSLSSTTLSAVPGNFALAAKFDLTKALKLEKMNENNRNNIVVTTANKDSQLSKDLIEIVQSKEFDEIIDKEFKGFDKPEK